MQLSNKLLKDATQQAESFLGIAVCLPVQSRRKNEHFLYRVSHHSANVASNSEGAELVAVHAVGVQVPDVNLHAGMVLGRDELVRPRAAKIIDSFINMLRS